MKKIVLILLLITSLFILKVNTTYANEIQIITYQNHLGVFLGYVEIDKDLYDYENWNPAQYGLEFVYIMENHVFIGWQDEDENLYADVDYDVVQGQYDTFRAAFEYTPDLNTPPVTPPTPIMPGTITVGTTNDLTTYERTPFTIALSSAITSQSFIVTYEYNEDIYRINGGVTGSQMVPTVNSVNAFIQTTIITDTTAPYLLTFTIEHVPDLTLSNKVDMITAFAETIEIYDIDLAYYLNGMIQDNIPVVSITQEMLDIQWQNGYLHAINVMADYYWTQTRDYIEQARNEGYNEGVAVNIDVKSFFEQVLDGISGIFTMVIMPGFTVGAFVMIPISFGLFKWFMKIFGGRA